MLKGWKSLLVDSHPIMNCCNERRMGTCGLIVNLSVGVFRGVKVAERMLGNRQDAENVMQETCLKIWREAPTLETEGQILYMALQRCVNACLDRKRALVPVMTNEMDVDFHEQPIVEEQMIEDSVPIASDQRCKNCLTGNVLQLF